MKLIEELVCGECFQLTQDYFIVTTDFKKNNDRLCVSLVDGSSRWLKPNTIVEVVPIYRLDKENNIIPFRETPKDDVAQNTNIS